MRAIEIQLFFIFFFQKSGVGLNLDLKSMLDNAKWCKLTFMEKKIEWFAFLLTVCSRYSLQAFFHHSAELDIICFPSFISTHSAFKISITPPEIKNFEINKINDSR